MARHDLPDRTVYVGIDPGEAGGVAIITEEEFSLERIPGTPAGCLQWSLDLAAMFHDYHAAAVFLEKITPRGDLKSQEGAARPFKLATSFGLCRMWAALIVAQFAMREDGLPGLVKEVSSQRWQRDLQVYALKGEDGKPLPTGEKKAKHKDRLIDLFPWVAPSVTFATVDAGLIAAWGAQEVGGLDLAVLA